MATDVYTTEQGDVWDLISYRVYGEEGYISQLINANPEYRGVTVFGADVELVIPPMPAPSKVSNLPPWRKG